MRFTLTITTTAHQEWEHTGVPEVAGACERIVRSEGLRDLRFKTAAPVVVRVAGGRLLARVVRNLTGRVALAGAHHISETCGGAHTEAIADCIRTRRSFQRGRISVRSTRSGSITLGLPRVVLRAAACPREPADVRRAPLGSAPVTLRAAALENERARRITLTATVTRRKTYGPVEQGTLEQRSAWRVTLVRLAP